jgi:hypothetical protein
MIATDRRARTRRAEHGKIEPEEGRALRGLFVVDSCTSDRMMTSRMAAEVIKSHRKSSKVINGAGRG